MIAVIGIGANAQAGVIDQLVAVTNISSLPLHDGVPRPTSYRPDLNNSQIEAGIVEAVVVASDRIVAKAGRGNMDDASISLSLELRRAKKRAVRAGMEAEFVQLQEQVNEALLAAVPAMSEFLKADTIRVGIDEPRSLLVSHETAVSDFLRQRLSSRLQKQLAPFAKGLLDNAGATDTSALLSSNIDFRIPLDTIIRDFVVLQSIDGFFRQLEVEESAIRKDVGSRDTDLLKLVFG